MLVVQEPMLLRSHAKKAPAHQWQRIKIKWLAHSSFDASPGLLFCYLFGCESKRRESVDALHRTSLAARKSGTPNLMAPYQFVEGCLQRVHVQLAKKTQ